MNELKIELVGAEEKATNFSNILLTRSDILIWSDRENSSSSAFQKLQKV
jgi:hypothetical protein